MTIMDCAQHVAAVLKKRILTCILQVRLDHKQRLSHGIVGAVRWPAAASGQHNPERLVCTDTPKLVQHAQLAGVGAVHSAT
jgi:hypothetical protein